MRNKIFLLSVIIAMFSVTAFTAEIPAEEELLTETNNCEVDSESQIKHFDSEAISFGKDGAIFEFEDLFGWAKSYVKPDENASGGYIVKSSAIGSEVQCPTYEEEVKFTVTEDGVYSVHFLCHMVRENLSNVQFSIDDKLIAENSNGTDKKHFSTSFDSIPQAAGSAYVEDFYDEMNLSAGEHTMKLTMTRALNYHAVVFDTIYFYQPKEYTEITLEHGDSFLSGAEIPITILDQDSQPINSQNYSKLSFTTGTPSVIKVDGNKIYARNPGKGIITVELETANNKFIKEFEVDVIASNGLILKSASREGTKVMATLYSIGDYSLGQNITLSSHNVVRGLKTSFLNNKTVQIPQIPKDEECVVEFDIADWSGFDRLDLFVHNGGFNRDFNVIMFAKNIENGEENLN